MILSHFAAHEEGSREEGHLSMFIPGEEGRVREEVTRDSVAGRRGGVGEDTTIANNKVLKDIKHTWSIARNYCKQYLAIS